MSLVTVTDLVVNFAAACRALVPFLDRAGVPWKDGHQYDNMDQITEALFYGLVTEPCAYHAVGASRLSNLRIARYGFVPSPEYNAYIAVEATQCVRMIDLTTLVEPFDQVHCELLGALPLGEAKFAFVYEGEDGISRKLSAVDLDAE